MANKNWPMGFQAVQRLGGGVPIVRTYTLNATAAIYKGEPLDVALGAATGQVQKFASKTNFNTAVAAGKLAGVAAEFYPGSALGSTKTKIAVWDPINTIFEAQVNAGATASTNYGSYIFKNAQATTLTGGSTITGLSNAQINFTTLGSTATWPIRIIDISKDVDNCDVNASYCNVLCQFVVGFPQIQNTSPA